MNTKFVLPLLLLCSALVAVQGSRVIDVSSKLLGGRRRNGLTPVEDRGCSSTSKVAAVFSLSQASPAACLASPVAALYSRLFIITAQGPSCKPNSFWAISPASNSAASNPALPFSYAASPQIAWTDAAGKAQIFQSWDVELSQRQDSSPEAPWAMPGPDLTPLRNTSEGLRKMLPFLLPHQYALLDNSTAVNLAPYNISMTAQGFKAFQPTTGCTFTWQIAAGSWAGFASNNSVTARPDPSKPAGWSGTMAHNLLCPAGAALQGKQCTMCNAAKNEPVKQLAEWLTASKRLSFMGWDLAGDFGAAAAADAAAAGIRSQGFVWQLLGSWNSSSVPLRPADDCSGTSRGPGPQAALTHFSDALDTNALLFSTVLATGRKRTPRQLPPQVYDAAAGSCKPCSGQQAWQGWWGDVAACGSCSGRVGNGGIAGAGNWWCAGQRNLGWPTWNSA
ncbi:hypothetical protein OEZ86_013933 [Tetradesmus obliquus]|nr:hypothetical protein OEZ86_013933 [Tetradesmus obliquus]